MELHREGKYDDAAQQFTRVVETQPENPLPHIMQGVAYFNGQRFRDAVESFARSLPLTGDDPVVRLYRGETLLALDRPTEARGDFEAARYSPRAPRTATITAQADLRGWR